LRGHVYATGKVDHVFFPRPNLDETVKIISRCWKVLDPEQAKSIVWDEGLRWIQDALATFVNPNGAALQF